MDDEVKAEIAQKLSEIILDVMPDATMLNKYGGKVFGRVAGQPDSQYCGVFISSKHVSLEFTNGAKLKDPNDILEGSGKQRRHIKLKALDDVQSKHCREFLEQACDL